MNKIITSLLTIGVLSAVVIGGTMSFFSDTETSVNNTFTAGTINLKVGDDDPTIWNFVIPDIEPGDSGSEETILANIGSTDGYLHISFDNRINNEMECVEPELNDLVPPDDSCGNPGEDLGELAENLDLLVYIDENSNDDFDLGTDTLVYQGKAKGILQGDEFNYSLLTSETRDFRIEWSLDLSVGNIVQSDKTGFDIVFELTQVQEGIVGDWHFNENSGNSAYDSSGRGNNGTINGAEWADGEYNPALSFNGINDYVEIADSDTLDISEEWTIAMWVKWESNGETYQTMFNKEETGNHAYSAWIYNSRLYFGMSSGGAWHQDSSMGDIPENIRTYVLITFDGNNADAYINGGYTDTLAVGGAGVTNGANLYLGRRKGVSQEFKGIMDEVKIYNRVLDGNEIAGHYQAGL